MKNILIVGANFDNKGAQSMLYITIDEILKKHKDAKIYFATRKITNDTNFNFENFYFTKDAKKIALEDNKIKSISLSIKACIKDLIKLVIGKKEYLFKFNFVKKNISKIDLIIDISGFSLGNKWNYLAQKSYIDNIKLAKKHNIPIYLMPQSFGPFEGYESEKKIKELYNDIKTYLRYPEIIFAREEDGYNQLVKHFNLENVLLSNDLVLQNKGINVNNIYKKYTKRKLPEVKTSSVAIVPNIQCFNHGNAENIINCYIEIIKHLLKKKKNIYLFRHSYEDLDICKKIKNNFINDSKVILLENDFTCIEYDEFIKQFDFIICSRYHGNIHAYRNFIPSIILGWAIKYKELAKNVSQDKYVFNITDENINQKEILNMIDDMLTNLIKNKKIIKDKVKEIQKNNCFDEVFNKDEK